MALMYNDWQQNQEQKEHGKQSNAAERKRKDNGILDVANNGVIGSNFNIILNSRR